MICYTARKARSELLGLAFLLKKVLHLVCYGLSLIMIRTRGRFQHAAVFRDSPRTVQKTVIAGSIEAAVQYRRRFPPPVPGRGVWVVTAPPSIECRERRRPGQYEEIGQRLGIEAEAAGRRRRRFPAWPGCLLDPSWRRQKQNE